ncbi:MAG: hypothetical protein ABSA68_13860 [Xanthobacteraceae bacterium]
MGGFSYRPLHVEMEYRFCAAGTFLGQSPPAGVAHPRGSIANGAITDEIDVDVRIGRSMTLEIVEEGRPVRFEPMYFEIAEQKREAVVNADER